ncbi:MAG: hypothetical protein K1X39_12745 [Thermoflexales bacterium]|nr:hypothetical protein [Thermoflexales bacterium]
MKRLSLALLTAATAVPLIACSFLQNLPIPIPGLNRNPTATAKPAATAPRPSPTEAAAPAATQKPAATAAATAKPAATAAATVKPGATTAAPAGGDALDAASVDMALAALKSYRMAWTMSWAGKDDKGAAVSESLDWAQEYIAATKDQHFKFSTKSGTKAPESMEWYQVGNAFYIYDATKTGKDRCLSISGDSMNQTDALMKPTDILGTLRSARRVKSGETVNGVVTDQYDFNENVADLGASSSASGSIWVARDGKYPVRYTVKVDNAKSVLSRGTNTGVGTLTMTYNTTDVNKVAAIQVPADCAAPGGNFPVPANATEKSSFGSMITFKTTDSVANVVAFYKKEMAALGYKLSEDNALGADLAMQTWAKDNSSVSIMISRSDNVTNVILTEDSK